MQVQKQQTVLAPRLPLHSRHCQLPACHFQARSRSRFLRTACPVAAPGFELVVFAAVRRTKEAGHPAAHAGTAVAAVAGFHSGMTVPDLVYLSRLADSTQPAPPHLA
jgi:hypothetical protein